MKKLLASLLVLVLCLGMGFPVFAGGIAPRWENVNMARITLSFDNGEAYCRGSVTGKSGTTKIEGTLTLEKLSVEDGWVYQDSWALEPMDPIIAVAEATYSPAEQGEWYRLTIDATVYKNGVPETISVNSKRKYE